jgi:hypothetical protein
MLAIILIRMKNILEKVGLYKNQVFEADHVTK